MTKVQQRTPVAGPTFLRHLTRLVQVEPPSPEQTLSERLSHWIDWNRAISLSRALDGKPAGPVDGATAADSALFEACARARAALADTITGFRLPETSHSVQPIQDDSTAIEFALFRQHYLNVQRSMQTVTGRLRGRLREFLSVRSNGLAHLAEVDAVMEMALSPREQALLAKVPTLLEAHFDSLRRAAITAQACPTEAGHAALSSKDWLETFRRDMQDLLLAELDVRFQPIEGLLAALRTPSQ